MAINAASVYGTDVACVRDADGLFTKATGLDVVRQHAFHRITTDSILGDDGTESFVIAGWGFNCRRLLGIDPSKLPAMQPVLAEVLTRDERVQTADVKLSVITSSGGTVDVLLDVTCTTAEGSFRFVKSVGELTSSDLVAQ